MKTILALVLTLIMSVPAQGQEKVVLAMDTFSIGPVYDWEAGHVEDGRFVGQYGMQTMSVAMHWYLPADYPLRKPDSIEYIVRGNASATFGTYYAKNNWWNIRTSKLSHVTERITIPFKPHPTAGAFRVGVTMIEGQASSSVTEVDAVYLVYNPRADTHRGSVRMDSALAAEEAAARAHVAIYKEKWHTVTGAVYETLTSGELEQLKPSINLYGWQGLNWHADLKQICFRKNCIVQE